MADSLSQATAYQLGGTLREIPRWFEVALRGTSAEDRMRRPGEGHWSAIEVLGHMVDKMTIWSSRLRAVATQDLPAIPGYDQDALVRAHGYQQSEMEPLLVLLDKGCDTFATLVENLPVGALERQGIHSEMGLITGRDCITIPIQAAGEHLAQLKRALTSS